MLNILPLAGVKDELDAAILELRPQRRAVPAVTRLASGGRDRAASRRPTDRRCRTSGVAFAHNSERQFAKLLDFYGIEWEYEPRTFILERDRDGQPTLAFTPRLLPARLRPLHRDHHAQPEAGHQEEPQGAPLRELYPEVKVRILYQRDYLDLLVKYGLESPAQLAGRQASAGDRESVRATDIHVPKCF